MFSSFFAGFTHIGLNEIGIIFAVLVMDASLSGDNSIAINGLVMDLPEKSRGKAIYLGMVFAAILRVIALGLAAFIMRNPWVQILGGLYLIKLCVDHFRKEEEDAERGRKKYESMIHVLIAVGFLDLSLSLDNVVAVVAMSQNFAVVVLGVLASIIMLAVASQIVRKVMARYPSLEPASYIILAFLGLSMLAGHGSEFLVWAGAELSKHRDAITQLTYKLSDKGEIIGVGSIIVLAIAFGEYRRIKSRRELKNSPQDTATSTVVV
jgi:YkoY family integral membrane protein